MKPPISTTEATDIIAENLTQMKTEKISLVEALGRVLASDIVADRDAPPFDRVMMDGICISTFNHKLGSWRYQIIGTQAAGAEQMVLPKGEYAIEVMTGASLPEGANSVIPVEKIGLVDGYALPHDGLDVEDFQHIHQQGSDCKAGDTLVAAGTTLSANELAIAASVGAIELEAYRQPNIHLITTGDEVVDPAETPRDFQIRRSHSTAIRALLESNRLGSLTDEHLKDDPEIIEAKISESLSSAELDALILTGGISMGKFDWVAPLLEKLLGEPAFHGVAQRPGKPFAFWFTDTGKLIFALPGNPVSVMATMHRYVLPSLRKMLGQKTVAQTLPLAEDFDWDIPLTGILPYKSNNGSITIHPPRNSGDYICLHGTHGFIEIPPHAKIKAGQHLPVF